MPLEALIQAFVLKNNMNYSTRLIKIVFLSYTFTYVLFAIIDWISMIFIAQDYIANVLLQPDWGLILVVAANILLIFFLGPLMQVYLFSRFVLPTGLSRGRKFLFNYLHYIIIIASFWAGVGLVGFINGQGRISSLNIEHIIGLYLAMFIFYILFLAFLGILDRRFKRVNPK